MDRSFFRSRTAPSDLEHGYGELLVDLVPSSSVAISTHDPESRVETGWDYGTQKHEETSPYDIKPLESYCYPEPFSVSRPAVHSPFSGTILGATRQTSGRHNIGSDGDLRHLLPEEYPYWDRTSIAANQSVTELEIAPLRSLFEELDRFPTQTNNGTFQCYMCQMPFEKAHLLNRHQRLHERTQICEVCGKDFAATRDLRRHFEARHTQNQKRFFCNILGCTYSHIGFRRRDNLIRHNERVHPGNILATYSHTASSRFDKDHHQSEDSPVHSAENGDAGANDNELETGSLRRILELRKQQLNFLGTRLAQLMTSISALRLDTDNEVDEGVEYDSYCRSDSSWSDIDADEESEDVISISGSEDSWVVPVLSHQAKGYGQSEDISNKSSPSLSEGSTTSGQSHDKPRGKRKRSESDPGGDDGEESNGNDPTFPSASRPSASDEAPKANIPCIVDGCNGRDKFASYLVRYAHKHHMFLYCRRCCRLVDDEEEYARHRTIGDICNHHCISSTCQARTGINIEQRHQMPSERRHVRELNCPPFQKVALEDLWQYMYHLKYPGRITPNLILHTGPTHPHGRGRPRPNRKQPLQAPRKEPIERQRANKDDSRLDTVEKQLAKAQAAIEAMNQKLATETDLRKQIQRLENIIRTFVRTCNVPDFVQEQINTEAPHVMRSPNSVTASSDVDTTSSAGERQGRNIDAPLLAHGSNNARTTIDPSNISPPNALGRSLDWLGEDWEEFLRDLDEDQDHMQ